MTRGTVQARLPGQLNLESRMAAISGRPTEDGCPRRRAVTGGSSSKCYDATELFKLNGIAAGGVRAGCVRSRVARESHRL